MRNKKHRNLRDIVMGQSKPSPFPYRSVFAYIHTDRVPSEMMDLSVAHSFYNMPETNPDDYVCTVAQYIQRVKQGDIKGWGLCAIPIGFTELDGLSLDYALIDSHSKGNVFLPSPVLLGELWEYLFKSPQSIPCKDNAFAPYLPLYIFDYL